MWEQRWIIPLHVKAPRGESNQRWKPQEVKVPRGKSKKDETSRGGSLWYQDIPRLQVTFNGHEGDLLDARRNPAFDQIKLQLLIIQSDPAGSEIRRLRFEIRHMNYELWDPSPRRVDSSLECASSNLKKLTIMHCDRDISCSSENK